MRDRYKCDECGFKTTSDYVLKRHTQVSHESKNKDTKSKRKICNECGKRFNKESTYRTHVRTMHGGETNDGGTNNLVVKIQNQNQIDIRKSRGTRVSEMIKEELAHQSASIDKRLQSLKHVWIIVAEIYH